MTAVLDAAPLVALADRDDPLQPLVEAVLREEPGELVVTAPVTAEVDFLLGRRIGAGARRAFLADVAAGRFTVACLESPDHAVVLDLEHRYPALEPGLADLSIVIVAARFATRRLVTFDERDFRTIASLDGGTFTLLPADR